MASHQAGESRLRPKYHVSTVVTAALMRSCALICILIIVASAFATALPTRLLSNHSFFRTDKPRRDVLVTSSAIRDIFFIDYRNRDYYADLLGYRGDTPVLPIMGHTVYRQRLPVIDPSDRLIQVTESGTDSSTLSRVACFYGWPLRWLQLVTTDHWTGGQRVAGEGRLSVRWIHLLVNCIAYSLATAVAFWIVNALRTNLRIRNGRCIACGHPSVGESICPECGAAHSTDWPTRARYTRASHQRLHTGG
jgi:hypothetical protein